MAFINGTIINPNSKIQITFHRKEYSQTTCDYLCSKLDPDDIFDSALMFNLQGLTNKSITKLKVKEANEMVIKLLQAIVINDDLLTTDDETEANETDSEAEIETEAENEGDSTIVEVNSDSPQGISGAHKPGDKIITNPKITNSKQKQNNKSASTKTDNKNSSSV
jgi:hypothetical protein